MRITSKGQVTIPIDIRELAGLLPHTEVSFDSGCPFQDRTHYRLSEIRREPALPVQYNYSSDTFANNMHRTFAPHRRHRDLPGS